MQRIVIVDDSALNRRMLGSLVAQLADVEVLSFGSSAEAVDRAPALEASLFIVDYRMPAPDGMAVLTALRADARTHLCPVMMITAAEEREVCYAALERGASDFLVRPIDPREFTRRIGNLLALESARREAAEHLRREEDAARLNTARLDLIWRAGTSTSADDTFLLDLIDSASSAIVEGRHFAGMIGRVHDDHFEIEIANDVAEAAGEVSVTTRPWLHIALPSMPFKSTLRRTYRPSGAVPAIGAHRCLHRFLPAGSATLSVFSQPSRSPRRSQPSIHRSSRPSPTFARRVSGNARNSSGCAISPNTTR